MRQIINLKDAKWRTLEEARTVSNCIVLLWSGDAATIIGADDKEGSDDLYVYSINPFHWPRDIIISGLANQDEILALDEAARQKEAKAAKSAEERRRQDYERLKAEFEKPAAKLPDSSRSD